MRNLKLAFRTLARTPFVTTVAILSLALGIGANAAIYSMFNQLLLQPLPVSHPEQLVNLAAPGPKPGSTSCNQAGDCDAVFSYAMFRDLEKARSGFTSVAAHRSFGANIAYRNQTLSGQGMYVSGSYFPTLGMAPALGRLLSPADDRTIGGSYVAVLSFDYWQSKLGADPRVIDQRIVINGQSMTIVGVAPEAFQGTTLGTRPYVFVPISMRGALTQGWVTPKYDGFTDRQNYWVYVFARRAPGISMERAGAAINAAYHPIITDVEAALQKGMSAPTLAKFRVKSIVLADGSRGQSSLNKQAKTPLVFLFAVTGIVLLIACANIANLLLARAANRSTEMAVRLSLGATRTRLLTQLLAESLVLAFLGGLVSLLVAHWTLGVFMAMLPSDEVPMQFTLHWSTVAFTAALSIGTGLVFGLYPAVHSTRPDLVSSLKSGSGKLAGTRSAARFRSSLVTVQIALSMALLIGAGLFVKSLANVSREDLGIKIDHLVTFAISPELNGYDDKRAGQFFQRVEEELAALPGATSVSASLVPLIAGDNWGNDVSVQGFKKGPDTDANSRFNEVGPGYFHTIGVPVISGREFSAADVAGAPKVAIVNEAFAKKFGLGKNAVGKFMGSGPHADSLQIQIVGLVKDSKYSEVKQQVPPVYVLPYRQDTTVGSMSFYVRTSADPTQVLRAITALIKRLDPNLPVEGLRTMEQQVHENVFLDRMLSTLSAAFAALATLLAAIGLYGVLAYTVAQRTKEIGVRMALGADAGRVRGLILRQVAWMTLIGGVIGVGGAIALGTGAQSLLFGMGGHDPVVIGASAALLALVALLAGYVPALRASKIDPMQALRYE